MPFGRKQEPEPIRIRLPNYTPRAYQLGPYDFLDSGAEGRTPGGSRVITVWHRRGGKDLAAGHYCAYAGSKWVGAYYHLFPTAEQGRKALWTDFTADGVRKMEMMFPRAIRRHPEEFSPQAEMIVEMVTGSTYRILGADKIDNVGAGPLGIVLSEYSLMKPTVWPLLSPMLREPGPGGRPRWAWFNFTPRGRNHAWELFQKNGPANGWYKDVRTVLDTGLLYGSSQYPGKLVTPAEMMAEERADGMPSALVDQEYLCDFSAANIGAIWGEELAALEKEGRVCEFEHGRDDIFANVDIGHRDACAIWLWTPNEYGGLDFLQHHEFTRGHADDLCRWLAAQRENMGWRYAAISLPHDARSHHFNSAVSTLEVVFEAFPGLVRMTPNIPRDDGLRAGRRLLKLKTRFHPRCAPGLAALRHYHRGWDADKKVFTDEPVHDWSSNSADAFRYAAVDHEHARQEIQSRRTKRADSARVSNKPTGVGTLMEMFQDREEQRQWMN